MAATEATCVISNGEMKHGLCCPGGELCGHIEYSCTAVEVVETRRYFSRMPTAPIRTDGVAKDSTSLGMYMGGNGASCMVKSKVNKFGHRLGGSLHGDETWGPGMSPV